MSGLDGAKDQLKNLGTQIGQKVQESPAYAQAQDRYESLTPTGQKSVWIILSLLVLLVLFFIPIKAYFNSQDTLNAFEEKRTLLKDLFKIHRQSAVNPNIPVPPSIESLKSSIDSIITGAELLPEQNLGSIQSTVEGRLIPESLVSSVLVVKLAKLNLKQIVDIGSAITAISESIKMKDLLISASAQDTRYYDVTYKLYTLNVPERIIEAPQDPSDIKPKNIKKSKDSDE